RWDRAEYYDPDPGALGKISSLCGGFVDDIEHFDARFFGIAAVEARSMDPQHRMLLEVAWHALENANIAPDTLSGTATAVLLGISGNDYGQLALRRGVKSIDAYLGTGNSFSCAAGRLSYTLGLKGPCLSVDTACSSSLVAVHLAIRSLRQRECDVAIAGGVNAVLLPDYSVNFSRARMLSPDGRCRAFDNSANGYVRSEGCGVVVLKRLADAISAGDPIWAVIRGSAINQDGRSSGLTVPSGPAQQAVIRAALDDARLDPSAVGYVECHGTGTQLGDPIELGALQAVFGARRSSPLLLGSAKSNIGHLEAAAGVASLLKAALMVKAGVIVPHLHFQVPTTQFEWQDAQLSVATSVAAWTGPRVAGISSFGFSGSNAHLVLEEFPPAEAAAPALTAPRPRPLSALFLSAKTPSALRLLAARYAERLRAREEPLEQLCRVANTGRANLKCRLCAVAEEPETIAASLHAYAAEGVSGDGVHVGSRALQASVAFLIGDQDSALAPIARALQESEPAFRQHAEECRQIASRLAGASERPRSSDAIGAFSFGYALAKLWLAFGVSPDAVFGVGVGEYVAAVLAGALDVPAALELLVAGGRVVHRAPKLATELQELAARGCSIVVEIAASDALLSRLREPAQAALTRICSIDMTRGLPSLMPAVARLAALGMKIDWAAVYGKDRRGLAPLPSYPFEKERHWLPAVEMDGPPSAAEPLLGTPVSIADSAKVHFASRWAANQPA
ncbi:MAG TPA: type I polyketide synthase, partial [Polyangiaceae bacterium]